MHIRIPAVERKNGIAFRCEDLAIGYPEKLVAQRINLEIHQGSHVAVLGDNGQGKTTFLRTLAEDLAPKAGKHRWGHGLKVAYYAQHVFGTLHPEHTVYEHLSSVAERSVTRQEILNLAGSFLFKGEEVDKKVPVLSGGETARLCLAGLLLTKSQVMLLDEPTNHLDFETVEALGRALKTFAGTLFFISHDRTFVNLMASQIIEVNNGAVKLYPGNYEDYVYHLEQQLRNELKDDAPSPSAGSKKTAEKPKSNYHAQKELSSQKRKAASQLKKSEELLASLKKEREAIHEDFVRDAESWSRERNERYEELARLIEKEEVRWLELNDSLEKLSAS